MFVVFSNAFFVVKIYLKNRETTKSMQNYSPRKELIHEMPVQLDRQTRWHLYLARSGSHAE